jgi:hypothetical protein
MAEFVNCKRYLLLTYSKTIKNMMKLVAYAFPTQPAYSSLNPDAAVYDSPAHTDSHNQHQDEIKTPQNTPPTPPPPPHNPTKSNTTPRQPSHQQRPQKLTPTTKQHPAPTTVTEAVKHPNGTRPSTARRQNHQRKKLKL